MSYRDWGRGESSPRAREPIASWDDAVAPDPVDPYRSDARSRTPSRRRPRDRGQDEPVDAYLPGWAVDSGIRRADGGGRHAAPDDDEALRPNPGGGRRAADPTGGWREGSSTATGPVSEHTAEWTFDRPQEQGYVGSRRADPAEDAPTSGSVVARRPRRSSAGRPQVIWSGGEEPSEEPAAPPKRERPPRRARWATEEPGPAADPWERADEADPTYPPAVDPWDASGPHAAPKAVEVDPWDASGVHVWPTVGGADRWNDTGQWERSEVAGRWEEPDHTGEWNRDADGWSRAMPPRSRPAAVGEAGRSGEDEGFWAGTRLAGDDPRWMDPTTSAPRSPAVTYPTPRPRSAPGAYGPSRRRSDPIGAPRGTGRTPTRRRVDPIASSGTWARRLEDDLLDPDPGGTIRSLLYTAACYLIPAALVLAWLLTLDARPPAGCVTDITGGGCDSARAHALGSLLAGAPRFGVALASSLVVAALLRKVGTTWRATTIALAAAVVGGGLSTVLISVVTGQPIG
ncbi:hypothetical protein E1211_02850 [Micromonospora sp. 15K316]|uniref:hypothetical protein n=1 Tax=Micromonospora sp. 15K316 TaxID=2530376 RepID=UPI001047DD04|nr:hypothetical protein [Micromonospora sp. 15K316]TDC39945.1 hypothetical protein E1211_02850 [Micromonospora sp. 15K316]